MKTTKQDQKIFISIKVISKSSRNEIVGWEQDTLKIRLKAIPEKGEANRILLDFLSECLEIPKSHILLVQGHASRMKRICVLGISERELHKNILQRKKVKNQKE